MSFRKRAMVQINTTADRRVLRRTLFRGFMATPSLYWSTGPLVRSLFGDSSLVPIDDICQLPRVLVELKLQLPFLVDDQLGGGKQDAGAFVLIGIVDFDFAGGEVVVPGSCVVPSFCKPDHAVSGKANLTAGRGFDQADVTEVVPNSSGNGNAAHSPHFGESIHQPLVLALLICLDEDTAVFVSRELVDSYFHADHVSHLRAGAHRGSVDDLCASVLRAKREHSRGEKKSCE